MSKMITKALAIIGGIAVILGVIWSSIQIYRSISPDGPRIKAQAASYPLHYSHGTLEKNKITPDQTKNFLPPEIPERDNVAQSISHRINKHIDDELDRMDRPFFDTFAVVVNISNSGNREAQDLKLETHQSGVYEVRRSGEAAHRGQFDKWISLGHLRPGETVSVTSWPRFFSPSDEDDVRLTHMLGVEPVEFAIATNGLSAFPYRHPIITFNLILFAFLFVFLLGVYSAGRTVRIPFLKAERGEEAKTEPDEISQTNKAKP